ncbi:MAG: hypothetical protein H7X93_04885 [Sphingomonadaceae bacterium]|nr:hypothetical protein [Sphingomonadaceae bacterium]
MRESSDRIMQQADVLLRRVSPEARKMAMRQRDRRRRAMVSRAKRILAIDAAIIAAAIVLGLVIGGIGIGGFALVLLLLLVVTFGLMIFPYAPPPSQEALVGTELKALPTRTEDWLASQRAALPPPAARKLDAIATRLEHLGPQLQNLDPREPAAVEVRRLVGVELPELVNGYQKVPKHLRQADIAGSNADKQLLDGLDVVDSELGRMTHQLAQGELDALATQGRFLELKYKGADGID